MPGLLRRSKLMLPVLLGLVVSACEPLQPGLGPDVRRNLARGADFAHAVVVEGRAPGGVSAAAAVAGGYLERQRLGLGSPFRLADYALADPRLPDSVRVGLAWALLNRAAARQGYAVDAAALDRLATSALARRAGAGRLHLELIEGAVGEARDPRSGELAVRLAYTLAAAEGTVHTRSPLLAAQVAALVRDRQLARQDALRLLRQAELEGVDALELLRAWRAERRFEVEQPALGAPLPEVEREALELAPRLLAAVRLVEARLVGSGPPAPVANEPLLGRAAAGRLAQLADSLDAPPQTPVVVAVTMQRDRIRRPGLPEWERAAGERFLEWARGEERFAAHTALLAHQGAALNGAVAEATLWAAVGMRAYNQEPVWFPGTGGPTARELEDRFGLAGVSFDDDVPAAWRPYYRGMLAQSLADLYRVLPSLDLRGLRIRFGVSGSDGGTLALHDPRRRTIFLPPATGAGTIAHEVAHDIDWQLALRRYRVRGDYGTDRATRLRSDRLAAMLQGLTDATLVAPTPGTTGHTPHSSRPAEVFARSVDWFVVAALAREGRMNGYLSSVVDDVLTGYGTAVPPDVHGSAGRSLVALLDEVTPVYPESRSWFLRAYGPDRELTGYDLVRWLLEAPLPKAGRGNGWTLAPEGAAAAAPIATTPRLRGLAAARDAALAALSEACPAPGAQRGRTEELRRQVVALAAVARGRGIALEHAEELAGEEGRRWLARRFYGTPWPGGNPEPAAIPFLEELELRVQALGEVAGVPSPQRFRMVSVQAACNPRW
jgi:hypothetical protein